MKKSNKKCRSLFKSTLNTRALPTGNLLYLLPLSVCIVDVKYGATLVCAVALGTVIKEITNIC